jgi:hypothetical protein
MKKFTNKNLIELMNLGYTRVSLMDDLEVNGLIAECEELHDKYNNVDFEKVGVTYPSKGHKNKKSVIIMVSPEENKNLPSTSDLGPIFKSYIVYNNEILSRVTGIPVPTDSRYMINYRKYLGGTEPVFEHFDGEYLNGFIDESNYHFFDEALLPRFVTLLTLSGGGDSEGAVLTNVVTGVEVNSECGVGEMLIFDNVKFKHRVPKLIKPRILLGVRNFDFLPYHYILEPKDGYVSLGDKINYGYIRPIGCVEATDLMLEKNKRTLGI